MFIDFIARVLKHPLFGNHSFYVSSLFHGDNFHKELMLRHSFNLSAAFAVMAIVSVRDSARFKYKLMGFMVYF